MTVFLLWAAARLEGVYSTEALAEEGRRLRSRVWRGDLSREYLIARLQIEAVAVDADERQHDGCHTLTPDGQCINQGGPCATCPRRCAEPGCRMMPAHDRLRCPFHSVRALAGGRDTRKPLA